MSTKSCGVLAILLAASGLAPGIAVAHEHHEGDFVVARSPGDQLILNEEDGRHVDEPIDLTPIPPGGLVEGWSEDDPGFDHQHEDEAGYLALESGAEIWLQIVSLDPALKLISDNIPYDEPNDLIYLGDHEIHKHMTWWVDSEDAGFNPTQGAWFGTFELIDEGMTGYGDSSPFTLEFHIPEPTTLTALALGGLPILLGRRRRAER